MALWLTSAAYHALLFTRINPAAWLFAAAFVLEAALLLLARNVQYETPSWRAHPAAALFVVAALAYPLVNVVAGERYPSMPIFGVPCPTTLLTAGVLIATPRPGPRWLMVIPTAWCVVAGSAAWLLGVRADLMLFAAGALLVWHARPLAHRSTPLAGV